MNDERPRWLSSAVALAASLVVLGAWLAVLDRHPASAGWAGSWAMVGLAGALGLAVVGVLATRRIGALERAAVLFALAVLLGAGHLVSTLAPDYFRGDAVEGVGTAWCRMTGCMSVAFPLFGGRTTATFAAGVIAFVAAALTLASRRPMGRALDLLPVCVVTLGVLVLSRGGWTDWAAEVGACVGVLIVFIRADPRAERGRAARLFAAVGFAAIAVGGHLARVSLINGGQMGLPDGVIEPAVRQLQAVESRSLPFVVCAALVFVRALWRKGPFFASPPTGSGDLLWLGAACAALGLALAAQPLGERSTFVVAMVAARDAPLRAYDDVSDLGGGGETRVATQLPLVSPRDADREVVLDGSGRVVSVEGVGDIVRVVAPSSVDAQAVARAVAKVRRPGDRFVLGGPP